MKLLESQLKRYESHKRANPSDYSGFLNITRIPNYDTLDDLFLEVLAKPLLERPEPSASAFKDVPYLNSSLFELSALERNMFTIASVSTDLALPLYARTVLKDAKGKRREGELNTLAYLFAFLNAYRFSSEGNPHIVQDKKILINASVLGLIFEKLNGYQDGSFFTPGFITMYMARESLRCAVVQRFNDTYGWHCKDLTMLYNMIDDKAKANACINSLKICDPAVGSGHFLVSALNELIAIKHELGILQDSNGKTLRDYSIGVENDELIIHDENSEFFSYNPSNPESQRVQETLFHEKQQLIEQCLFGVDINPNSVKICRLRLWIELLKHAYYKPAVDNQPRELETLPNIDINIKTGNALIHRFELDASIGKLLKKSKWKVQDYREAVQRYRDAESKDEKYSMAELIDSIKQDFRVEIAKNDRRVSRLRNLDNELAGMGQERLFNASKAEQAAYKRKQKEADTLRAKLESIASDQIYNDAFEWRFEFPEVLSDDGDFIGFDVVIGNPPYIRHELIKPLKPILQQTYQSYAGTADIFVYFFELGMQLLRPAGILTFICSNKYFRASYGKKLRHMLSSESQLHTVLDFGDAPVFEEAIAYPSILTTVKQPPDGNNFNTMSLAPGERPSDFETLLEQQQFSMPQDALDPDGWRFERAEVRALLSKLRDAGVPLGEYVDGELYYGIKTGYNEVFIIDANTRERLITEHPSSAEVIKPFLRGRDVKRWQVEFAEQYLIKIESSDNSQHLWSGKNAQEAERIFAATYPAIHQHFQAYRERLTERYDQGKYFWELRACAYWQEFEKPKIIYPNILKQPSFAFDASGQYTNQKCFIIPLADHYLLGLLNSTLTWFLFHALLPKLRGNFYEPSAKYFEHFPIRKIDFSNARDKSMHDAIVKAVDNVLELHKQKVANPNNLSDIEQAISIFDARIDTLVYELYNLTDAEIAIIEASCS